MLGGVQDVDPVRRSLCGKRALEIPDRLHVRLDLHPVLGAKPRAEGGDVLAQIIEHALSVCAQLRELIGRKRGASEEDRGELPRIRFRRVLLPATSVADGIAIRLDAERHLQRRFLDTGRRELFADRDFDRLPRAVWGAGEESRIPLMSGESLAVIHVRLVIERADHHHLRHQRREIRQRLRARAADRDRVSRRPEHRRADAMAPRDRDQALWGGRGLATCEVGVEQGDHGSARTETTEKRTTRVVLRSHLSTSPAAGLR